MKVQVKKLPHSEVELTITVPYEFYLTSETRALEALSKEIKVDGFRSGHIPEAVIRERVSPEGLISAAMEFLLPETYAKAVQDEKLAVIAPPKVEIKSPIKKAGDELVYVALVAIMPAVKVGNYKKIKVKRKKPEVTPAQLEETIQMILDRFANWKNVTRAATLNDRVEVDFEAFDSEGKAVLNTASKNHPIVLGSNVMVPGFEDALIGMNVGETKEFDLTFPKTYHAANLQGKKVKFRTTLKRLEEKIAQTLDEAFIEKVTGEKQTLETFKKRVETDLLTEMATRLAAEHDNAVVNEIIKITEVDLPRSLIDEEIRFMLEEKKRQVASQGLTWEQYLAHVKKTEADFTKDHAKGAEERLKARLGVQHILKDAKVQATEADVDAELEIILARVPEKERNKARDHYKKDSPNYQNLKNNLAADKLIDMLSA